MELIKEVHKDIDNSSDTNESLFGDVSDVDDPTFRPTVSTENDISDNDYKFNDSEPVDMDSRANNSVARKLSRKRTRNPETWKQNIRKKREKGQEYVDIKNKNHLARSVEGKCDCRMKCSQKVNEFDQNRIHASFWMLPDNMKSHFYSKFIERNPKKRRRPRVLPQQKHEDCYKQYSYEYFFEISGDKDQVCKKFFLLTLDISARRGSYFFSKKYDHVTSIPTASQKGKNIREKTSEDKIKNVREHIKLFPKVESHYCRFFLQSSQ